MSSYLESKKVTNSIQVANGSIISKHQKNIKLSKGPWNQPVSEILHNNNLIFVRNAISTTKQTYTLVIAYKIY